MGTKLLLKTRTLENHQPLKRSSTLLHMKVSVLQLTATLTEAAGSPGVPAGSKLLLLSAAGLPPHPARDCNTTSWSDRVSITVLTDTITTSSRSSSSNKSSSICSTNSSSTKTSRSSIKDTGSAKASQACPAYLRLTLSRPPAGGSSSSSSSLLCSLPLVVTSPRCRLPREVFCWDSEHNEHVTNTLLVLVVLKATHPAGPGWFSRVSIWFYVVLWWP